MKLKYGIIIIIAVLFSAAAFADEPKKDKGKFIEYNNPFWTKIKESSEKFQKKDKKEEDKKSFKMDFTGYDLPKSTDQFEKVWFNDPISQGWTGTCWCFAATSFFESEIERIHGKKIKISELFTVYWEYVEKARRYVRKRGNSLFAQGSQPNAVRRAFKKYGCVPADAYTGKLVGQEFHDHHIMFKEMKDYLQSVKKSNAWNENKVIETIKSIMNHYLSAPPDFVELYGRKITPLQYFESEVNLNMNDYVDIMSLKQEDYYKKAVYNVPDNWWKCPNYYNIPLDEYMKAIKNAVKGGYSIAIGGDVSETGYNAFKEAAMIPSYDIPSEYIDENARQLRFSNGATTDDHGIHIVGFYENDEGMWFLIKDSGSGSRNGSSEGHYFYHEDYIKLKMMNIMIHKDAVKNILNNFEN